jgi:Transcription elongation factor, GreA/GreB, C-term
VKPTDRSRASFGATVTLRRSDGREQRFRIVGEDEADPRRGTLSYVSPLARAVSNRRAGETVEFAGQLERCWRGFLGWRVLTTDLSSPSSHFQDALEPSAPRVVRLFSFVLGFSCAIMLGYIKADRGVGFLKTPGTRHAAHLRILYISRQR